MTSNGNQLLTGDETSIEESTSIPFTDAEDVTENGFARIAIGVLVGATLGGIAAALTNRGTVDRVNQTVKNAGDTVKKAAASVNDTVQDVGDAVSSVATGVNNTVREVGDAVKETAEGVNGTVKNTLSAVKDTTEDVNDTVRNTLDAVKQSAENISESPVKDASTSSGETLYKLVPINSSESNL